MLPKQCPASLLGAVLTFWAGFAVRGGFGPLALAADAEGWQRTWPGHELEASSTATTATLLSTTSTVVDCSSPAPVAPVPAAPQPLRVVGDGLTATVEIPLAALVGASAAGACGAAWRQLTWRSSARVAFEPIGEARIHYEEDAGWVHERLLLWPSAADGSEWMVYAAGTDLHAEAWTDYRSAAISLLRRARGEVVLEHGSDAADWRTQDAVDWNGGRLAVPSATALELSAAAILRERRGLDRGADGEWVPIEYVTTEEIESWRDAEIAAADRLRPARARLDDRLFRAGEVGGARAPPAEPGGTGAAAADSAGQDDLHTCWTDVDETGARFKEWRKAVQESTQEVFSDSSLRRPPARLEARRMMCRHGGAPEIWFQERRKEAGISRRDRAYHEVQTLIECLYLAGACDQVNMGELASLEVVARRLLQCAGACARGADRANWAAAKHLAGTTNPQDLVPDALRSFASRRSKEERELEALRARAISWPGCWMIGARAPARPSGGGGFATTAEAAAVELEDAAAAAPELQAAVAGAGVAQVVRGHCIVVSRLENGDGAMAWCLKCGRRFWKRSPPAGTGLLGSCKGRPAPGERAAEARRLLMRLQEPKSKARLLAPQAPTEEEQARLAAVLRGGAGAAGGAGAPAGAGRPPRWGLRPAVADAWQAAALHGFASPAAAARWAQARVEAGWESPFGDGGAAPARGAAAGRGFRAPPRYGRSSMYGGGSSMYGGGYGSSMYGGGYGGGYGGSMYGSAPPGWRLATPGAAGQRLSDADCCSTAVCASRARAGPLPVAAAAASPMETGGRHGRAALRHLREPARDLAGHGGEERAAAVAAGAGRGMGGGMYGNRQQESEFFAPKRPEAEGEGQQQHPVRLADLREMNASFLDALHAHGVRLASAAARLLESVVGPRLWARDWRAAAVAIGAAALAAAARAWLRRRRRLAWRALSAGSYLAAGPLLTGPQPLAFAGALAPRAAL
ncbi:unnamed protein product [Prorocentrum cordatum]|uniref:Uncharacterized protein n=1 Tax=Prorocentrum cordatum TaxID=2364126 RepID=A0ABN9TDC1_9DINO|nr:unnamed protein product [Polarella glacialis]